MTFGPARSQLRVNFLNVFSYGTLVDTEIPSATNIRFGVYASRDRIILVSFVANQIKSTMRIFITIALACVQWIIRGVS